MNLTHIDPGDVIAETLETYQKIGEHQKPFQIGLSRQVQALAYVLTEQLNNALLEIENGGWED